MHETTLFQEMCAPLTRNHAFRKMCAPLARNHTFLQKHRNPHAWIREQLSKSANLPDPTHAGTKYPRSGGPLTPISSLGAMRYGLGIWNTSPSSVVIVEGIFEFVNVFWRCWAIVREPTTKNKCKMLPLFPAIFSCVATCWTLMSRYFLISSKCWTSVFWLGFRICFEDLVRCS